MAGGANMGQNMGAYVAAAVRSRATQIILQDRQVGAGCWLALGVLRWLGCG
jgi:hypothetical protein